MICAAVWYIDGLDTPNRPFLLDLPNDETELRAKLVQVYKDEEKTLTADCDITDADSQDAIVCRRTDTYGDYYVTIDDNDNEEWAGHPILFVTVNDADARRLKFIR